MSLTQHLYRYNLDLLAEINTIIEEGGEITDKYESLIQKYPDIIDQLCEISKQAKQNIEAAKQRITEIESIQKQNENLGKFAKNIILGIIPVLGSKTKSGGYSYKTSTNSVYTRDGVTSVFVSDSTLVPSQYTKTEVITKVDKEEVGKALKEGKEVDGCSLVKGEVIVVIK